MKKDRRKAIEGKLVGESKTSPGYFKYRFTILELDGTKHDVPAYGKDMEDALERLVWSERVEKVSDSKTFNIVFLCVWITTIIVPSIMAAIKNEPIWILSSIGLSVVLGLSMVRVDKYFNKK